MKEAYTFYDWEAGIPFPGLPDLPDAEPKLNYSPDWGKGSEAARRGVQTKNWNIFKRNKKLFMEKVFPHIQFLMDSDSLKTTALAVGSAKAMLLSGYQAYGRGEIGAEGFSFGWLHYSSPHLDKLTVVRARRLCTVQLMNHLLQVRKK